MSLIVADCTEQLEGRLEVITNFTNRGQVPTAVAVVWRTPYSNHVLVVEVVFIAFVHQLVRTRDQGEIIDMAKLVSHAVSEKPT